MVNTAYAYRAAKADAADLALLGAGVDLSDPEVVTHRQAFDDWLAEPFGRTAEAEQALLSYLKGA